MKPHRFGGIVVDPVTYQVVDSAGTAAHRLYAVGELTSGTFGFTSALEINVRHARNCATRLFEAVSHGPSPCSQQVCDAA